MDGSRVARVIRRSDVGSWVALRSACWQPAELLALMDRRVGPSRSTGYGCSCPLGCPCSRSDRFAITSHRAYNIVKPVFLSRRLQPTVMPRARAEPGLVCLTANDDRPDHLGGVVRHRRRWPPVRACARARLRTAGVLLPACAHAFLMSDVMLMTSSVRRYLSPIW